MRIRIILIVGFIVIISCAVLAQEEKKIQDNSFLLEEAYNQEDGVIQHIQLFQYMKDKSWGYYFTQEWPVPRQKHQLSYTIPVLHLNGLGKQTAISDMQINYRYQFIYQEKEGIAIAPRFSLMLPTGERKNGFGKGTVGLQVNIPISIEIFDRYVMHWNIGTTFIPKEETLDFNFGASIIWLIKENFNLMMESAWNSYQSAKADGMKNREEGFFLNPGARFAINLDSGLQIVPGVAFPIGIGPSSGKYGILLYLSFEHPLFKVK